ncbi:MAG TPA: type IX secretion system sortase PorU, partial [Cyclobacteriaceae bacterium]|nr:type IX secretion system sortase PorU [Cyclobacteriaceae bacterium]
LYGKETVFTSSKSLSNAVSTFNVSSFSQESLIWDVSDAMNAQIQSSSLSGTIASFSTNTTSLKTFVVFTPSTIPVPTFESAVPNQNLHVTNQVDLIIVTHPDFESEALRLAGHRTSYNQLSVRVVTTTQIYNEYSGGKQDVTAIRDFIRSVYINSDKRLKNLLLFGRCSYDFKNRVFNNTNFVPTYESQNSLSPLETYSSDDYFGFMDINEGTWSEDPIENHTLEIGVGRLPVKKIEEAKIVVDKLIDYDTNPAAKGKWRNEILFVADDGDYNLHQDQAEQLATSIGTTHPEFTLKKIYVDAFAQVTKPSGQTSPDARLALEESLRNGSLIVNFTGHGSEQVWMDERILDATTITNWTTKNRYPLMVTATCEFGRHDDPAQISTSELALLKSQGGAIGLVTTSRPVFSSSNFTLNQSFYAALFKKENGKYRDLGSQFRDTKNTSLSGVGNRNFSLLGDPSMHLAIPENQIVIDEIKTVTNSDTLKALSHVIVKGKVQQVGVIQTNFTGTLQATLFDKEATLKTLGDENAVFNYKLWNNTLFSGQASVKNGEFQFDFILPQNMATEVSKGKLNIYAQSKTIDAAGALLNFAVGKIESSPLIDLNTPSVRLFMGDTTFINGGITGPNTSLIAKLVDQSGINISAYGATDHSAVAILDDTHTIILNSYYQSDVDDYTKGTIQFPLMGLSTGKHSIIVKVWDTHNNPSMSQIEFVVTDAQRLEIQEFFNYPNPFSASTEILFSHNRAGEDLEALLSIYSIAGHGINQYTFDIPASQARVRLMAWDGTRANGTKLDPGLYIMKVLVRSLQDGSKNEQITKLIILN